MYARSDTQFGETVRMMVPLVVLEVEAVERVADSVISVRLRSPGRVAIEPVEPGAHIDVHVPGGLVRQYSVIAYDGYCYEIGIQRDPASRGGSAWLFDNLRPGMQLETGLPRNNFGLEPADAYRFIAGGIGITPIAAMVRAVEREGIPHSLHYVTRDAGRTPFLAELSAPRKWGRVEIVHDHGEASRGLDIPAAVAAPGRGERLYCCGPAGLMDAVKSAALAVGWAPERLHFEAFKPVAIEAGADHAFTVVVSSTGEELPVPVGRSVLDVLTDAGYLIDSACSEGICGTCQVGVLAGVPDHRDSVLSDAQRAAGNVMQVCCSRAAGDRLVLDL